MDYYIRKYKIPIIWLDTFVIINMTKSKYDEGFNTNEKHRYSNLFKLIQRKVFEGKIICPQGDQNEEIEQGKRLEKECQEVQAKLSYGVKFIHRSEIETHQLKKAMKAYVEGEEQVILPCARIFENDPVSVISGARSMGAMVTAYKKPGDNLIKKEIESKQHTLEMLEDLRQYNVENNISYEKQLELEYMGMLEAQIWAINNCLTKVHQKEPLSYDDYCQLGMMTELLEEWRELKGQPVDFAELQSFFNSDYHRSVPVVDIKATLAAKMVTSDAKIQHGDAMDVGQLSAVTPYCDYIVTDRKMKNRIIELGIDRKYNTRVLYIGDLEELIDLINAL